ncbi:MAG: cysteine--tRNA ligase [Bacteroidales bacterium]|nr:cysteine--tRNA ligase [Bacteroidales bacterium]
MSGNLFLYNTLTRKKEKFVPLNPPHVGMYVCGPTVYSHPHLGHARPAIVFDILFRYLKHLGYKVRYVRNITDVGHLENEVNGEGEDKILKKARLEKLEPMEVVQQYSNSFHAFMEALNVLPPSIEPRASGHIIEQIELIKAILKRGYAYESNGSVYFDLEKYNRKYTYGKLSGRVLEDLMTETRKLEGQSEKKSNYDFALWKKADDLHIMKWPSPWSIGFPGWHLECSAMSSKYLGETFDIHGGGMDLVFPHHECEIAQSVAAQGHDPVRYWIHNNMITINGQKMARSLGNFITLEEVFSGTHALLVKAYSPMTVRFYILQAHYSGTLDFSNEALSAAEQGLSRMFKGMEVLAKLQPSGDTGQVVKTLVRKVYDALNDNLNTPIALSALFDGIRLINAVKDGKEKISAAEKVELSALYDTVVLDILGLKPEKTGTREDAGLTKQLVDLLLQYRMEAKEKKDFAAADSIRSRLTELGIIVRDTKDGFEWEI